MKYIIDMSDEYVMESALYGKELAIPLCVNGNDKSFYLPTRLKVEAYTEPDRKAIEDEVWEFAKKIGSFNGLAKHELDECFGHTTIQGVMTTYDTYSEAKDRYEAWKKQKEEICVGDEVEQITASGSPTGTKCIVVKINGDKMNGIGKDGSLVVCSSQVKRWWTKTGRHFDEIEELLKKMRGEE